MPSPDLRTYVDLTLDDRDAQDIFDAAVADLAVKLPDLVLREGTIEAVLLEALALEASEATFRINRIPGAIVEILLQLFELDRSLGTPPTGQVIFTVSDTLGHEIPAGTRVRLNLGLGLTPVDFTTDDAVMASVGFSTATADVTGTTNTDQANGLASGTTLELLDAISFVESVETTGTISGGTGEEDQADWLDRGVQRFSRLVSTLVLPEHFTAAALEDARVSRATTIDNHNGTSAANGHVAVAVLGLAEALLSGGVKTEIETALEAQALALLDVHVIDPTVTAVDVTATLMAKAGYDTSVVDADATAAIDEYLSPSTWEWSATVRWSELIALLDNVEGVDYVVSLTVPSEDVSLTGIAPLANAGTINITVNAP